MIRNALIPDRSRDHNNVPHRYIFFKHAAATTGNKLPAAKRNCFFKQARRDRRADTWMEESQSLILIGDFIDTMRTVFPLVFHHDFCMMLGNHFINDLSEETDYAMLG